MTDHPEIEPVHGLPKRLPPGEEVLWQGRPSWRSLARQVFRLRWLTFYFALLVVARITASYRSEEHTSELQSHSELVCRLLLEKKNLISLPSLTIYLSVHLHFVKLARNTFST